MSTMNSYKRVLRVLKELFELGINGTIYGTFSVMADKNGEYSHRLYEILLPWLIDPTQTSDAIIHLLTTDLPTRFKGFSSSIGFQEVIAFLCLRALVERKQIIEGSWECLVYIIIKFNRNFDTEYHQPETLCKAKKADVKWLKGIQMLCSPNQCPNPCLRLELIRLNKFYRYEFGKYYYDHDSPREFLINALCDIYDMFSSLSSDQIYMSVTDLVRITYDNSLDIQSIINMDQPDSRKTKIIGALIKITGMFIRLEKEHSVYQKHSNLLICSRFICLIPNDCKIERYFLCFINAIHNKPILLDYMIATYSAIDAACRELGNPYNKKGIPFNSHTRLRNKIIYMVFKKIVNILPMHHLSRQVNGGFTPAIERHLRYFSNNARQTAIQEYKVFIYNDPSDSVSNDSEYSFSDENDSIEDDSEEDDSEEDDSEEDDSEKDDSEEDYDESDAGEDE